MNLWSVFFILSIYFISLYGKKKEKLPERNAFLFQFENQLQTDTIKLRLDSEQIPIDYKTTVVLDVCDDTLCSNLAIELFWDLAGNYLKFDTIKGKPLTKFDNKKFNTKDYEQLNRILKDRNSILSVLDKSELTDKNTKLQATTVDAVTSATPASLKKAVVEGAVYSSYTLWYAVNGMIRAKIREHTRSVFSYKIFTQMLQSQEYENQLFALQQLKNDEFNQYANILFDAMEDSSPLVRAYILGKLSLPFAEQDKNVYLTTLLPKLDTYSRSIFIAKITTEKEAASVFIPLLKSRLDELDSAQKESLLTAWKKFGIAAYPEY